MVSNAFVMSSSKMWVKLSQDVITFSHSSFIAKTCSVVLHRRQCYGLIQLIEQVTSRQTRHFSLRGGINAHIDEVHAYHYYVII